MPVKLWGSPQFVYWTLPLAFKPLDDTRLVELAEALQAHQLVAYFILLHADGTLLCTTIFNHAVLLRRGEGQHPQRMAGPGRGSPSAGWGSTSVPVLLDTSAYMCLAFRLISVCYPGRQHLVADRTQVTLTHGSMRWTAGFCHRVDAHRSGGGGARDAIAEHGPRRPREKGG